ncbi:MAG: DUF3237 domain-containing protein [Cyclobacteriaceae bacterium]|nr:DUF3237 domain-containing protein [Cyclobacteriaceae bacterium]
MQKANIIFGIVLLTTSLIANDAKAQKLDTEFLYKIDIVLEPGVELGKTPLGKRVIYTVKGGTFNGPKLKGKVRQAGGDWVLRLDSITTKLDVKLLLETDDGQLISNNYTGIVRNNPDGTTYWRITPTFETSSKKYEWLNYLLAVGVGKFGQGGVSYEVFAIK